MKRFSLNREERLKSNQLIRKVYLSGKRYITADQLLRAFWLIEAGGGTAPLAMAAAVSRKAGNAVWRNRVKRLVREAYRLEKAPVQGQCRQHGKTVRAVISPYRLNQANQPQVTLAMVRPAVADVLQCIGKSVA